MQVPSTPGLYTQPGDSELRAENERLRRRVAQLEASQGPAQSWASDDDLLNILLEAFESVSDGFVVYDASDRFVTCNDAYRKAMGELGKLLKPGVSFEDVARARAESGLAPSAVGRIDEWVRERVERHRQGESSFIRTRADGRWILATEHKTRGGGTVIIRTDVTERVLAEEALRDSEERFRGAFENTGVGIMLMSHDGTKRSFNQAFCRLIGYTEEEMRNMRLRNIAHPDDDPRQTSIRHIDFSDGTAHTVVRRFIRKDGRVVHLIVSHSLIRGKDRNPIYTVSLYQDISEQIKAQEELRRSEEKFRTLIEGSIQGVLVHRNYQPLFANQAYADILGFENPQAVVAGGTALNHYAMHERERVARFSEARMKGLPTPLTYEVQGLKRDGGVVWLENRSSIVSWEGQPATLRTVVDISERKQIEQQLRQAQKMEAIGQLTGGLAHDFNNLLSVIMINTQLVADRIGQDRKAAEMINAALGATMRGAELTKRLLAFSRQQILEPEEIDIDAVVAEMGSLLRQTIGETIEIEILRTQDLWSSRVDRTQLESALLNLALNARDAMPSGGALTIETGNIELDEDYTGVNAGITPGQYVLLAVSDNGVGMTPEVLQCAFEPFFSTKEVGAGTGLGLSMIYGFVKQSNGHIKLYSEPGRGTTVKMYFPRDRRPTTPTENRREENGKTSGGHERILVVEDQVSVRESLVVLLSGLGYELYEAETGRAALDVIKANPNIDLILTDVVMPGNVDGPTLARIVHDSYPKTRVLLMSGYTHRVISRDNQLDDGVEVIAKPFHNKDLARKIREVLDR
jgi:PAS domain S-box-containing protein